MTWVKLDDAMPDHPKVIGISDAALGAYVRMLCYSSHYLLDGDLPADVVARLVRPKQVAELVERGLWRQIMSGYLIVNYGKHQRSRAQIEGQRAAAAERQRVARDRKSGTPQLPNVTPMSRRDSQRGHA